MYRKAILVLFLLTLKMVFGLEPQCSPFHYQEQLIEKMVKLEIFVQKMKDDIAALQQRVNDETETLKEEKKLFKSDLETEKTSVNSAIQQLIKMNDALMQNISSSFQQMVEADNDEMRKHAEEVKTIKDSAVTPAVVFLAKDVTTLALVSRATFIFKTSVLNEGKGYDNTTGRFTAPIGGTYLFTIQFCLSNVNFYLYYDIVLDGTDIKSGVFGDNDTYKCYSADVLVILKAGAQVWVTTPSAFGSLWQDSDAWNTFSGVLLNK